MESTKFFKNDPPEVLVLPPNILEKLGINLGNIPYTNGTETKSDAEALAGEINTSNVNDISSDVHNNNDGESSILETAHLMRASVFLSPTFTNLKPNNVINDPQQRLETANFECNVSTDINNAKSIEIIDKPVSIFKKNDRDIQEIKNNNCKNMSPTLSNKINITSEEIIGSEKIKELLTLEILDNRNLVPVPINTIITKNTDLNNIVTIKSFKENNKIQCTDNNNTNSVNISPSNGFITEEMKNPTMKLEKQSQNTISLKKNDDVKILKEVNTENEIEHNGHNNSEEKNPLEKDIVTKLNEIIWKDNNKLNEKSSFVDRIYNDSDLHEDCINNENEDIYMNKEKPISVIERECKSAGNAVENVTKNYSEHCTEKVNSNRIQSDIPKVNSLDTNTDSEQEIAINCNFSYIENNEICNNKVINVNKNKVKSKLCIQGVEKPGGESDSEHKGIYVKDLKTYSRGKRTKFPKPMLFESKDCLKSNINIDVDINCDINNTYSIKDTKTQKFCICKDFGYLSYYDKVVDYQHIHYWEQKTAECSLDMLLSIYEENKVIEIVPDIDNEINRTVEVESEYNNVYNICWMNFDVKNTKDVIESSEGINQKAKTQKSSNNSQSNSEILSIKHNEIVSQMEIQNVSGKSSKHNHLNQSKKKTRKRKISEDNMDEIKNPSISEKINSEIIIKKDKVINDVKLNEPNLDKIPSTKKSSRKSDITNKLDKTDAKNSITGNNLELVAVNIKKVIDNINDTLNNHCLETDLKSMKRKRSLVSSEGSSEETNKKKKKDGIKCGVCKIMVENINWDNHVANAHCYIAWEDGQKFDFNNEDLFNKLKQHLKEHGKLTCVICDKIIKRVKIFLNHVEGCVTYRNPFEMTDDSINEFDKSGSSRLRLKPLICVVCKAEVNKQLWMEHIAKEHNYLAWKEGETPLDIGDESEVTNHLRNIITEIEKLECNCGVSFKCPNSFMKHIEKCGKATKEIDVKVEGSVKCGVCGAEVFSCDWMNHISKEHRYLAWKQGEPELDVSDSHAVYEYLHGLSKERDGLYCGRCGCRRKYVNSFLKHVETCDGEENLNCTNSTMNESSVLMNETLDTSNLNDDSDLTVKCGVCQKEIETKEWEHHIRKYHSYMAWKDGQTPLNFDDEEEIYNHLYTMSKKYKGLTCARCGMTRKYVKVYLHHVKSCNSQTPEDINKAIKQKESYKCGVCSESVPAGEWRTHAMDRHYNVAWPDGQTPIDSKNATVIEKCLKEYKQVYNKYVCNVCGVSRVSAIGFYAHVIQCGKTEEEIDPHRDVCDICNNKYLIIYKNQHLSMHRDQEYAKQRKLNLEVEKEEKKQIIKKDGILPERRLAAERARNVIEKYKKYKYNCNTCDFGGDSEEDVKNHTCRKKKLNFSDSEDSVQLSSEQESDDTEVNYELSNEEEEEILKSVTAKKKKHADPNPAATFFPFSVQNPKSYISESAEDFRKNHLTSDILFPKWRKCKYEVVPDELLSDYLPTVEESCKLQLHKADWMTLKKFESINDHKSVSAMFAGGCVQCMSWCPAHAHAHAHAHYVSVSTHQGTDAPRHDARELYTHHGMVQIWDFGDMHQLPKFALGIAHDFGTIWAKDWCPSGARDVLDEDTKTFKRLGLLAVACSNGSAYILSVPYPSTITEGDKKVYKLTPVAELRLTRGSRQKFQATAINWTSQKDHSTIIVGYSDGTTALYNLHCDSPILTDAEDGVDIYYPYQDERTHNSCVTAVSSCPGAAGSSSATGGSRAGLRVGRGGRATRSAVTATAACFMPHWPDLLLAGNDAIVYQAPNVVSWCGGGRRLGSQQAVCGCTTCGRVAIAAPPALRLVTAHPAHAHLHKTTVALLQMKPLVNKKTKQKNDDLGTILEPSTYEEAIKKYGVELTLIESSDKSYLQQSNKPRDHYPERFPLSDVSAMAFNTSPQQHKKLAVATHSGLIFIITV